MCIGLGPCNAATLNHGTAQAIDSSHPHSSSERLTRGTIEEHTLGGRHAILLELLRVLHRVLCRPGEAATRGQPVP